MYQDKSCKDSTPKRDKILHSLFYLKIRRYFAKILKELECKEFDESSRWPLSQIPPEKMFNPCFIDQKDGFRIN